MKTATIREVQHNLAAYLRQVEQGQEVEIRRRNRAVARLVPADDGKEVATDLQWGEVRKRLHRMWGGKPARGKPVSEIVYESRGDR